MELLQSPQAIHTSPETEAEKQVDPETERTIEELKFFLVSRLGMASMDGAEQAKEIIDPAQTNPDPLIELGVNTLVNPGYLG